MTVGHASPVLSRCHVCCRSELFLNRSGFITVTTQTVWDRISQQCYRLDVYRVSPVDGDRRHFSYLVKLTSDVKETIPGDLTIWYLSRS